MRFKGLSIIALMLALLCTQAFAAGCGYNWLGGDDTVTPVGFDRPWLDKSTSVGTASINNPTDENNSSSSDTSDNSEKTKDETTSTDISGMWTFKLVGKDNVTNILTLKLYPAGTVVYGNGNLTSNGASLQVLARGSIQDETVKLDILQAIDKETYTEDVLYHLDMDVQNHELTGSYEKYVANDQSMVESTGNVVGQTLS